MDAAETHLAKLRAIQEYLQGLSSDEDDDLVLIVDGYDIILQLPVEVMIERYFTIRQDSDAHLAERFKLSVEELHAQGIRNTIFWGPDKICWPIDWAAPRCWAVPASHMPDHTFGPNQGDGGMATNDPKWLNSGTVIGPVGDMRRYINVTMAEIARTYDANFENSESDQFYLANVWGRQEYRRSKQALALREAAGDDNETVTKMTEWLAPSDEHRPPEPVVVEGEETEFHVSIEYESALFQTKAGYETYFGYLKFDQPGYTARMDVDMYDEGVSFVPYSISMPAAVYAALTRVYEAGVKSSSSSSASRSLPAEEKGNLTGKRGNDDDGPPPVSQATTPSRSRLPASEWIRSVNLGVNYVTRHVYGLWHCTGDKEPIDGEYRALWFFPFVASLLRANALASRAGDELTAVEMDGRAWLPRLQYPVEIKKKKGSQSSIPGLEYGGAFTDFPGEEFLSFGQLCGEWQEELFAGEIGIQLTGVDHDD
ncbi:hypothetical protein ISF_00439 [Cordyceps fumosorosea ARSEF 2679]|uniref:Uncharacterized protein n=1 Tax=Cordyceps fumosorosea (strain ARSEF 2679) TaxID=1081104 RepID=A0A168E9H4_CORFA|nr:hypothetical protein ISF_00439 [Cordyceps fumosorosea ARSEF 2679]OAA73538.1 hypothetical protein ISF_00439 [Cordyceps fumosorosea ARSEF 2679]